MDDKTYKRMIWGCSCGHVARSALSEARHRHNFPSPLQTGQGAEGEE